MLTKQQRELAEWIAEYTTQSGHGDTFYISWSALKGDPAMILAESGDWDGFVLNRGALEVLAEEGFVQFAESKSHPWPEGIQAMAPSTFYRCTVKQKLFDAIARGFEPAATPVHFAEHGHPHPPEIQGSLSRLRRQYPDPQKLGFLIMRFSAAEPYQEIVTAIKNEGEKHGISIIRADEREFHADLWGNVRTILHGCSFGIAVYERIETDEPNANIGLEVGYLMAMNKPVLLLKDKTVKTLQSDLAGKLYRPFDPHNTAHTIPDQLESWLRDNAIIL